MAWPWPPAGSEDLVFQEAAGTVLLLQEAVVVGCRCRLLSGCPGVPVQDLGFFLTRDQRLSTVVIALPEHG